MGRLTTDAEQHLQQVWKALTQVVEIAIGWQSKLDPGCSWSSLAPIAAATIAKLGVDEVRSVCKDLCDAVSAHERYLRDAGVAQVPTMHKAVMAEVRVARILTHEAKLFDALSSDLAAKEKQKAIQPEIRALRKLPAKEAEVLAPAMYERCYDVLTGAQS